MTKLFVDKERDYAIDIVKFLAVLMVINIHAGVMYPQLKYLQQVVLLVIACFCFVRALPYSAGAKKTFCSYYKRRINRIYPSVFA